MEDFKVTNDSIPANYPEVTKKQNSRPTSQEQAANELSTAIIGAKKVGEIAATALVPGAGIFLMAKIAGEVGKKNSDKNPEQKPE